MGTIVTDDEVLSDLGMLNSCSPEDLTVVKNCITAAEGAVKRFLKYDPVWGVHTEYYPSMDVTRTGREYIWEVSQTEAFQRQLSEMSSVELQIKHLPIRTNPAQPIQVKIDYDGRSGSRPGSFGDGTLRQEGYDYWPNYDGVDSAGNKVCRDGILKSIGLWPAVAGCTQVIYYAGYLPAEFRGTDSVIDVTPIWDATKDESVRRVMKILATRRKNRVGVWGPFTSETLGDYTYSRDPELMKRMASGADLLFENQQKLSEYENVGWMLMS